MYAAVTGSALQWMLAVQAAPQVEMTPAETLAGLLLLTVVMAGLGMSLSWLLQITRGQHPLPQARRSTLLTPPMAVLWTTLLTIPLSALAVISSLDAQTATAPATTTQPAANAIEQPTNPGASTASDAAAADDVAATTLRVNTEATIRARDQHGSKPLCLRPQRGPSRKDGLIIGMGVNGDERAGRHDAPAI